ncbi:MAG: NAD(P)-dependent alcohol dehydrogenase [Planctomycetota bacterium]|nr:NAD(P)-dependent alcohol dehydrogenase [Planctomycetota bacterium]
MKAIHQRTYGSADVLELTDLPEPVPGPRQVRLRVRAAGVDRGVWHLMAGKPYLIRILGFGFKAPKQPVPGMDVAGIVEAVGSEVTRFQPGDEVFGIGTGTFAELALADESRLAPKPASMSFEEAAVVPISASTALQGLRDVGKLEAGQRVLILGAGGGVGSYAVQLAKAFGAHVTGVCSTAKLEFVAGLGADAVIDYTREDCCDGRQAFDLILDIGGNRPLAKLRRALTQRGTLVIVGGERGGPVLGGIHRQLGGLILSPFLGHNLRSFVADEDAKHLATLTELIEAGKLRAPIDRRYSLAEAPEAIRRLDRHEVLGKGVVVP